MKKSRFTLVELLGVVALISLLAVIGFAGYSYAMNAAKESATRSLIKRLEAGLQSVKTKHGTIPPAAAYGNITVIPDSAGIITSITFGTTTWNQSDANQKKLLKDFLAVVDAESLKNHVKSQKLEDSWGGKIMYRYPGLVNKSSFDLISAGPDGNFGAGGSNVPPTSVPSGKSAVKENYIEADSNEWICDDIANF